MLNLAMVDQESDLTTTNMPWSFRFHPELKKAILAAIKESKTPISRPEWVARACCDKLGIEYVPNPPGRPWPEGAARPAKKPKKKA